jgi:hypothetical protein
MFEILRSFKRDWGRWSPGERAGALIGMAVGLPLILAVGIAGLTP